MRGVMEKRNGMTDAPERIWIEMSVVGTIIRAKDGQTDFCDAEYIRKDIADKEKQEATKAVKEVWEKYKDNDSLKLINRHNYTLNMWQAIIATGKEAGWIEK